MNTGHSSRMRRYGFPLLLMAATLCCGMSGYFLWFKPRLPECRAGMRLADQVPGSLMQSVLMISVVPQGARGVTLLLNGSVYDGDTRYVVDRILMMDYRKQGDNYTLRLKEKLRKPQDNLEKEELNRRLLMSAPVLHWHVEQLDSRHYLFSGNYAPFFVCATKGE